MSTNSPAKSQIFELDGSIKEWLSGFLLVGLLVGLPGSLLIAWQYHIDTDPRLIGFHFLALSAGYVIAARVTQRLLRRWPIRRLALAACAVAFASLSALTFLVPPVSPAWRMLGFGFVGSSAGALSTCLFYVLEPYFAAKPAEAANRAGVLFVCGCLVSTLMVGVTYFAGSMQIETGLLALVPLIYFAVFLANRAPAARARVQRKEEEHKTREVLRDLRTIAVILFGLILFFQFGNEWAIAGWLPLFLTQRLGTNPVWAIFALAGYFLALLFGRLTAQKLLLRVKHRRLLIASTVLAMFGCILLTSSRSFPLACISVAIVGAGFAPIYPLTAETLDERFSYHPGFYNGIFSIAVTGGMCAPWVLGYVNAILGIRYVMLLPAVGSIAVLIVTLLIMLEARLMVDTNPGKALARPVAAEKG